MPAVKSGDLVISRPNDGTDEAGIGIVCLVGDARVVVEWSDGQRTEIPLPAPSDIEVAPAGSLRHRSLRDAEALQQEFAESPVSVLVTLLGERGGTASFGDLRRWIGEFELAGGYDNTWWGNVRKELDTDPRVTKVKGGGQWKLLPADRLPQEHMPSIAVATAEHDDVEAAVKTEPCSGSAPNARCPRLRRNRAGRNAPSAFWTNNPLRPGYFRAARWKRPRAITRISMSCPRLAWAYRLTSAISMKPR